MLDTHSEVQERPGARPLPPLRHGIEFRNVSFAYDDGSDEYVLRDVSFSVRAGQIVAIVGLERRGQDDARQPDAAVLRRDRRRRSSIDGVDIRDVTLASLRAQIGIVTQETVLFDDTIAAQHRLRAAAARRAREIEAAARAAHAHEFIVSAARGLRDAGSASAGSGCRAASGSGWRSRGRC